MEKNNVCLQKYNLLSTGFNQTRNISIIKSNLLSRCSSEWGVENKTIDSGGLCCKWCLNTWSPGNFSLSLQPQSKPKKGLRRLLKKDINSLNKFQQKLITKVKSSPFKNTLVIKCTICNKNTLIGLRASGIKKQEKNKEKVDTHIAKDNIKKKKKKKASAYAGLNPAIVESIKPKKNVTPFPTKIFNKTQPKKLSSKQQLRINKEVLSVELSKKKPYKAAKPSLLSSFLDGMNI